MDHDVVVRDKITEKYLLNELPRDEREQFEEHFFDCPECALDVRAAAAFVEQSKVVLAENPSISSSTVATPGPKPKFVGWFRFFRPAFAVPVLAVLLTIVGYQNLFTIPKMTKALRSPSALPWASINIGTWGSATPAINTSPGRGFLLFVRIPPESGYAKYQLDFGTPAGKVAWSLTVLAAGNQDEWPIQVPGTELAPGTYTLTVLGVTGSGESHEVGRASFELHFQN